MNALLTVADLVVAYPRTRGKNPTPVLKSVSLQIEPGHTLGLVGESGSGKTTLGRAILGLVSPASGRIIFSGDDITHADRRARRRLASDLQVVFQDPYSSLNPSMTIESILSEPLAAQGISRREAVERCRELIESVGMPADTLGRLPRAFSGGQRQRIAIARALALSPKLIVCDEPVSALDLSTQSRVLDLFLEIQQRTGVSYLFISHDLDVVHHISHDIAVLYQGELVETGDAEQVSRRPTHPYTRKLLLASPVLDPERQAERRQQRLATVDN